MSRSPSPSARCATAPWRSSAGWGPQVLDFGTTGRLRHSDLVMWDRQTESWWQQLTGEAIIGELAGERLEAVPASIVSYATFKETYPQGLVLARPEGFYRDYGRNPYTGYDDIDNVPFLYQGEHDSAAAADGAGRRRVAG